MTAARPRARLGRVLLLLPGAPTHAWGGIQASALDAWRGVRAAAEEDGGEARALWYAPRGLSENVPREPGAMVATSRVAAMHAAFKQAAWADTVLCWHLGLLRLAPLVTRGGARLVLYLHGIEAWQGHRRFRDPPLGSVDMVLFNSRSTWRRARDLRTALGPVRHRHVALGIDEPLRSPTPVPLSSPVALMLGRLVRDEGYKGHREVIAAWSRVTRRLPEAELWIAGDGDLRPELEAAATGGPAGDRIRFWGRVDEPTKARLLEQSWCLALPSRSEGFGLVYAEAMRVGRPCLVGPDDGGREVVDPPRAGLAVDPANADALVEGLLELLRPGPEWDRRSAAARLRYEARFTATRFQRRLAAALRVAATRDALPTAAADGGQ